MSLWLALAGVNGLVAVGAGAYGWHWLETHDYAVKEWFMVGVQYHMWHALALLGVAWVAGRPDTARPGHVAGACFMAGIVLFSGTLYVLGVTGSAPLSGAAPIGGGLLMAGWACLVWAALKARRGS